MRVVLGAYIGYNLPDWYKWMTDRPSFFEITEDGGCNPAELAGGYLTSLGQNQLDAALKAVPPRRYRWTAPNGYGIELLQGSSKDGISYQLILREPGGRTHKLPMVVNRKQAKLSLGSLPLTIHGENFGKLDLALGMTPFGLKEVEFRITSPDGHVTVFKLKPSPCELNTDADRQAKLNLGSQADAGRWATLHLARAAKAGGGALGPALLDVLLRIRPGPGGLYRNHGVAALDVLTVALNALRQSGVDMRGLEAIQRTAAGGNGVAYAKARVDAQRWLQARLAEQIRAGRIDPLLLRNAYGINFGVPDIALAAGKAGPVRREGKSTSVGKEKVELPWRSLVLAMAPYKVRQTRDGRLFVGIAPDAMGFNEAMARLAAALHVDAPSLRWAAANLSIGGARINGVVVEARRY
ncbi:hypothetical protein SAMN06265795_12133 [Noviherbaspirillum humi]|uniref:Uncharacterized protein n=2 Tax=Noviherbaspirillum humi TaxID=1688639 RepID=A0A239LC07_9BURK|nr:hypothetical protein SAMN06265795_12133 [Noviherbaspirillum humi]